jgi:hypothetical protein
MYDTAHINEVVDGIYRIATWNPNPPSCSTCAGCRVLRADWGPDWGLRRMRVGALLDDPRRRHQQQEGIS